jgi:hypothetical protein
MEIVRQNPHALAVALGRLPDRGLQQLPPDSNASVEFIQPELLDLGHPCPSVASNGSCLLAMGIQCHECQPSDIILTRGASIVIVESICEVLGFGCQQVVPGQNCCRLCSPVRPSLSGR